MYDRFPLRESHWLALGNWVGTDGPRRVARLAKVSPNELDAVVAAQAAPTTTDRSRLIDALVRCGKVPPSKRDHYAPDGSEYNYGLAAHKMARGSLASNEDDRAQRRW